MVVSPNAVLACAEIDIDISNQQPKSVDNFSADDWDTVISMGCGVSCPAMKIDEDWDLEDPVGQTSEVYSFLNCQFFEFFLFNLLFASMESDW